MEIILAGLVRLEAALPLFRLMGLVDAHKHTQWAERFKDKLSCFGDNFFSLLGEWQPSRIKRRP